MASVPAAAGLAWRRYRQALDAVATHPVTVPHLPGVRRTAATTSGSVAYRLIEGRANRQPLVLIHGWGKTADAAWWPLYTRTDRTILAVDLPRHGQSRCDARFDFDLAAEAVRRAIEDAGVDDPILVAHSMGGPVALSMVRAHPDRYAGLVALATSAYWVRPRLRIILAMAPYAMTPRSPVLLRTARAEFRQTPDVAEHIAWAYTRRPQRRVLDETATALRRFDARTWEDLELPPTLWVVAGQDGVLAPEHQEASGRYLGGDVVTVDAHHSLVVQAPDAVAGLIHGFADRRGQVAV